ncbi:hypothetical protein BDZ89DRAFT_1115543 [Hymenopellis radicata]|nr:hypothetical protein BDZ89DRAFT_1115543 [Hymenopellis radicata]
MTPLGVGQFCGHSTRVRGPRQRDSWWSSSPLLRYTLGGMFIVAFELWLDLGPSNSPTSQAHNRRNNHDSTSFTTRGHVPTFVTVVSMFERQPEHVHRCSAFAGYRLRLVTLYFLPRWHLNVNDEPRIMFRERSLPHNDHYSPAPEDFVFAKLEIAALYEMVRVATTRLENLCSTMPPPPRRRTVGHARRTWTRMDADEMTDLTKTTPHDKTR